MCMRVEVLIEVLISSGHPCVITVSRFRFCGISLLLQIVSKSFFSPDLGK